MPHSKYKSRLMIIGLDGATFNVLLPWINQNKLPTIKKIMQEGTVSDLESTIPPITPVAWKSLMTARALWRLKDEVTYFPNNEIDYNRVN